MDKLVADFGTRKVFLAVLARVFRRTRPPDSKTFEKLGDQPGIDQLSEHLRRDLGLPPDHHRQVKIDLIELNRRDFY